jgi:subtilisin
LDDEYILLPARGLHIPFERGGLALSLLMGKQSAGDPNAPISGTLPGAPPIQVIDSVNENGPKLVKADQETALAARRLGLRLEPAIKYRTAGRFSVKPPAGSGAGTPLQFSVICKSTRVPVEGAIVTAFTNFAAMEGAEATTDVKGTCDLDLGPSALTLDRLYVHPPLSGFWGHYQSSVACSGSHLIELKPVQASYTDALAYFYGHAANLTDGQNVIVGVVDTGIDAKHGDLSHVTYGVNTAKGEPSTLWQDNGTGHGTHVAGIIGGRGATRTGVAPGVELCSFRAFPQDSVETTNYQIMKAMVRAMDHGCHIINLSLNGEGRPDQTLHDALEDANDKGILVVVAAGNEGKSQVGYPALYAFSEGLSVAAMGRKGTYPLGSHEESDVGSKFGTTDPDSFVARFSNSGDVSLIAPGVGIISTVPGGGYGVMSGTSMACPAVSGMAARLLSADLAKNGPNAILSQAPEAKRTVAMINLMSGAAQSVFNDVKVEGDGQIT